MLSHIESFRDLVHNGSSCRGATVYGVRLHEIPSQTVGGSSFVLLTSTGRTSSSVRSATTSFSFSPLSRFFSAAGGGEGEALNSFLNLYILGSLFSLFYLPATGDLSKEEPWLVPAVAAWKLASKFLFFLGGGGGACLMYPRGPPEAQVSQGRWVLASYSEEIRSTPFPFPSAGELSPSKRRN